MSHSRIEQEKVFHNKRFSDEVDPRERVSKYYEIARSSRCCYKGLSQSKLKNQRVLEYGCGTGSMAFLLAEQGATVTGVDISDAAVIAATKMITPKHVGLNFRVMNAEQLDFPDNSFDVVCGSGILHHLDLKIAYPELARVLTSSGSAIFFEPLGHNPFINLYRRLTPALRTEDEHPLLMKDLNMANSFFDQVEIRFFHLTTLLATPFRKQPVFSKILACFEFVDKLLFAVFPFLRRYAWIVVITLSSAKEGGGEQCESTGF